MIMKKVYMSLEELRSGCTTSALLVHVASTLCIRSSEGDQWNFVSAMEDGDDFYAEFNQPVKDSDVIFYWSYHGSPKGYRSHISTTKPMPLEACANF